MLDIARIVSLIGSILSLYALFYAAFLVPSADMNQRIYDSLGLLAVAGAIALIGGLVFRAAGQESRAGRARLAATLPVQLFCWASSTMLVLFVISWYLETNCIFYRDPHL
jgi:hypothetical protein